jgi:hypothetical protein
MGTAVRLHPSEGDQLAAPRVLAASLARCSFFVLLLRHLRMQFQKRVNASLRRGQSIGFSLAGCMEFRGADRLHHAPTVIHLWSVVPLAFIGKPSRMRHEALLRVTPLSLFCSSLNCHSGQHLSCLLQH